MFGLRRRRCPITRIPRPRFLTLLAAAILVACSGGGDATGPDDNNNNPPAPPPPAPTTGVISGRVTTSSGAALDSATVTTQPASGTATSDTQGNYSIAGVAPGSYTVTASKTGYNNGTATVAVVAGQTVSANLSLVSTALPFSYTQLAQIQAVTGNAIASIAISPDGRLLAYGSFADNLVHIVDVTTRQEIRTLSGHTKPVTELTFSPDSRLVASTGTVNLPPAVDGSVKIWDVSTGAQLATVATPGTNQLVFTPNGSLLVGASGGDPVSIRVWNVSNLSLARTITGVFRFAALSPDASRVASGGRNSSLHVFDFATGASLATHAGQTGWVTAAAYSANGQLLASASEDRTILIRNAQTGLTNLTLSGHTTYPDVLVFSPDGAAIASLGSGTNVTRSGSQVSISISSADRFIRIWNLTTGAEYSRVNVGSDVIGGISFSSDWSRLVTGSDAGVIRIFQRAG